MLTESYFFSLRGLFLVMLFELEAYKSFSVSCGTVDSGCTCLFGHRTVSEAIVIGALQIEQNLFILELFFRPCSKILLDTHYPMNICIVFCFI